MDKLVGGLSLGQAKEYVNLLPLVLKKMLQLWREIIHYDQDGAVLPLLELAWGTKNYVNKDTKDAI